MLNPSLIDPVHMPPSFVCEAGKYTVVDALTEEDILTAAKSIISRRFTATNVLNSTALSKQFFITRLSELECEVFCVTFLNNQCQLLACEQMFRGSIRSAAVYPREIVKRALVLNAGQVILAHNHPSGQVKPSGDDLKITEEIQVALALIDVKVVDHIIVGGTQAMSFSEKGLL